MIKSLKIKNFLSIKDEVIIDFFSSKRWWKKNNSFKIWTQTLTKNILLYGANASWKSNIIKSFLILNIVATKNNLPKWISQLFKFDNDTKNKESFFELNFFVDKKEYIYSVSLNDNIIKSEKLVYVKNKKNYEILFERIWLDFKNISSSFEKELNKWMEKIKENSSTIAVLSQWNWKLNWKSIDYIFRKINFIWLSGLPIWLTVNLLDLKNNKKAKNFLVEIMKLADFSIDDIKIKEKSISDDVLEIIKDNENFNEIKSSLETKVEFWHKINWTNDLEYLDFEEESSGTQRFFSLVWPIVDTIFNEKILFIDEIENKLHYFIVKEILKLINSNIKDKKYQFFFTTHNIDLLDLDIFRQDQIAFVEKNDEQSTEFYKLSDIDFPARKELDVKKYYKNWAFWAIPYVGDFRLLLNLYEKD